MYAQTIKHERGASIGSVAFSPLLWLDELATLAVEKYVQLLHSGGKWSVSHCDYVQRDLSEFLICLRSSLPSCSRESCQEESQGIEAIASQVFVGNWL